MEQNETRMGNGNVNAPDANKPKPLRKLKRVGAEKPAAHPPADASAQSGEYRGKHLADPKEEYPGIHSSDSVRIESEAEYRGQYQSQQRSRLVYKNHKNNAAAQPVMRHGAHEYPAPVTDTGETVIAGIPSRGTWRDRLVKIGAVTLSILLIGAMILNMPIFVNRNDQRSVSLVYLVKHWQPIAKEGQLEKTDKQLNVSADVTENYDDGLDLPQLIEGQYTVLLLGFDEDRFNTDVMWVLEFDIGHGELNILQIPRDCCLPDFTSAVTGKINSVYSMGDQSIATPIQRVVNAVEQNFGIPVDAYVTTGCDDIVKIIDLIGGIPIHLDNEIIYEADKIIPEGDIVLTGEQAEWFIRFRHEWLEGDIGRMMNQRRFMAAAMNKLLSIVKDEGRIKLYGYLKKIFDNEWVYTDLTLDDMSKVANFASTLSTDSVTVNMVPGESATYYASDGEEYEVYSVHAQATVDILNEHFRPYQEKMTLSDTAIQELVTYYEYTGYDDTSANLEDLEHATEPARNPDMKPWWKE